MRVLSPAFLTAARYDAPLFWGGVYDAAGVLQRDCLRPDLLYRHADPDTLPQDFASVREMRDAVYAGRFFEHFGHFLIETLPSIYAAAAHGECLLAHPWPETIPDNDVGATFRGALLEALGVDPARIRLVRGATRVDRFVVPDLPPPPMSGAAGQALFESHALVRSFALARGAAGAERVYLSRRHWPSARRLVNEEEIEEFLAQRGFAVVHPERLSILEQVRAVAGARVLIGVDGSALHLSSFMPPGGRIAFIETRVSGRDFAPYPKPFIALQVINAALGHDTRMIEAQSAGGEAFTLDPRLLLPALD